MASKTYLEFNQLINTVDISDVKNDGLFINIQWFMNYEKNVSEFSKNKIFHVLNESDTKHSVIYPMVETDFSYKKLQLKSLRAMSNYYSSLYGPLIVNSGNPDDYLTEEFAEKISSLEKKYDVLTFQPLSLESPFFDQIQKSLKNNGYFCKKHLCFGNWYLDLAGRNFDEYYKNLPSRLKNTAKRKEKKLLKKFDLDFKIVHEKSNVKEAMQEFQEIYQKSWKIDEPYPNFIYGLAEMAADIGGLRLGLLYVDAKPVAAQIWIIIEGTANIFKLAYDPEWGSYSVGSILTLKLMEHVIDVDKVDTVDYLTGDDAYKKDWMSDRRERWGIIAFNKRTFKGYLLASFESLLSKIKRSD